MMTPAQALQQYSEIVQDELATPTAVKRALIVDDNAFFCTVLGDALTEAGFEVTTAKNGREGLARMTDDLSGIDLLILDLHMPEMNGMRLLECIRQRGGERDLKIAVVSGSLYPAAQQVAADLGADMVIDKLVPVQTLVEGLLGACATHSSLAA